MGTQLGVEPKSTGNEPVMLPLHYRVICGENIYLRVLSSDYPRITYFAFLYRVCHIATYRY